MRDFAFGFALGSLSILTVCALLLWRYYKNILKDLRESEAIHNAATEYYEKAVQFLNDAEGFLNRAKGL